VLAVPAAAQLQLATVRGVLVDPAGQPLPGATIDLTDPLGAVVASRTSDAAGRFDFARVTQGRYTLRASLRGFDSLLHPLNIESALPINLTLSMTLRTSVSVVVDEGMRSDSPTTRVSVAGPSIDAVPVRAITKGLQEVIATLPGWATEDNGLLHVRGTDDGFLYVIDGVPVYERLDQLSGLGPNASTVESINVVTGYVPAEFGYKAGGVIDMRSKSSAQRWSGSVQADQGTENDTTGAASVAGPLGRRLTLNLGGVAQRSDRFLDPVHPDNLHNHGDAVGGTGQLTWAGGSSDVVSAGAGAGRMRYDVPNTEFQEDALQDHRQRIAQDYGTVSWQRAWSSSTVTQVSGYVRRSSSRLDPSTHDTPLSASADRSLRRGGAIASLSRQWGGHTFKTGAELQRLSLRESFWFFVTDQDVAEEAGFSGEVLEFSRRRPFRFADEATPSMWSMFVQDEWHAGNRVTLSGGLRFDSSQLLIDRRQLSPRIGVAWRAGERTVLRGSASRFFQPPQPENLLLSSSEEARELSPFAEDGDGGAEVEPERQWAYEVGIDQRIGSRLRLDAAFWYRSIRQAADPNVFAGTTIIFPNAVAEGRARGFDVRLEMPRAESWSAYVNASTGRVRQKGPINGGLFLEDEIEDIGDGEEFIPDHDQALVASAGVSWSPARSATTISATIRHETGTPIERGDDAEDELRERPGAELVDFDRGRVAPRTIVSAQADVPFWKSGTRTAAIRASVLNLFDQRYAYNFGNPFSGTHFGAPRTASIAVRVRF
jgi:outer membrane receptor protein involved in Fe transport